MALNDFSTTLNVAQKIHWGTTAPAAGTYNAGDLTINTSPAAAGVLGWVCTATGTPGTWKAVAPIEGPYTLGTLTSTLGTLSTGVVPTLSSTVGTIATGTVTTLNSTTATITALNYGRAAVTLTAAAALTNQKALQLISLSAGATMTFAPVASHAVGYEMTIKNLANNSVTIATAAGATYADASSVALAQYGIVTVIGDGSTWYKKS